MSRAASSPVDALLPPQPPPRTLLFRIKRFVMVYIVMQSCIPLILLVRCLKKTLSCADIVHLYNLVSTATGKKNLIYDAALIEKACAHASAAPYATALEYQKSEGYCAPATLRCILKSLAFPKHLLPPPSFGASEPDRWCDAIQALGGPALRSDIVRGDEGYDAFLRAVRKVNDPRSRVAINYLRRALVGFEWPRFVPVHFVFGLIGGHFSPVLAVLEEDVPLVAVFDVNEKFGLHLVPAPLLYEAVRAKDASTGKSRAVIVVSQ